MKVPCPKCHGLLLLERFSDFFLVFYAWRCVNCGAIIDKTIAANRRRLLPVDVSSGAHHKARVYDEAHKEL